MMMEVLRVEIRVQKCMMTMILVFLIKEMRYSIFVEFPAKTLMR
jgi:hypothetical protein